MLKNIFILLIVLSSFLSYSQEVEKNTENEVFDRVFFGGNFGLQFGKNTFIDVSPIVGFKATSKLLTGVRFIYNYYSNSYDGLKFSTNIYGGKIFGSYYIYQDAFLHSELELISLESQWFDIGNQYPNQKRFWVESILVGGGYRFMLGEHSAVNAMILYNLNESINSPYRNPILRLGFIF